MSHHTLKKGILQAKMSKGNNQIPLNTLCIYVNQKGRTAPSPGDFGTQCQVLARWGELLTHPAQDRGRWLIQQPGVHCHGLVGGRTRLEWAAEKFPSSCDLNFQQEEFWTKGVGLSSTKTANTAEAPQTRRNAVEGAGQQCLETPRSASCFLMRTQMWKWPVGETPETFTNTFQGARLRKRRFTTCGSNQSAWAITEWKSYEIL